MKNDLSFTKQLLNLTLIAGLLVPALAQAANVLLHNKPLVESSTSDVLPNLMFIIDDSGSMDFDYTPDWSNSGNPLLRKNPAYNTQYYNPNIVYTPAVKYDGVSMGNQASPWTAVKNGVTETGAAKGGTTPLVGNANYYGIAPGEYCKAQDLQDCAAYTAPTGAYQFPAPIRWCNAAAEAIALTPTLGTCRAVREQTFTHLRAPSATATITFTGANNAIVTSVKVDGKEILSGSTNDDNNNNTVASRVAANINDCTNGATDNCTIRGYSATRVNNVVTIVSPYGKTAAVTLTPVIAKSGTLTVAQTSFVVRTPGTLEFVDIKSTTLNYPFPGSAAKGTERDDCLGAVCTYTEEMTNYANWHTYYKTRLQGMKTSASLAFKGINSRYRVGFISIHNLYYLKVAKFDAGAGNHKDLWYKKLFSVNGDSGTPLRSSLSTVGRIFAGKNPLAISGVREGFDPVEYACQPNFALLTTDGYWNTDDDSDAKDVNGNKVGNTDGEPTQKPQLDANDASNTLADIAKYYADTDIRKSTAFSNCTGALGAGNNVCGEEDGNEANEKQTMKTLTLGLGIDGTLLYSSSYTTDKTGDYALIKSGGKPWPNPITNSDGERIDDLWHAAVNGDGTYFSAKDPKQLTSSLVKALSDITSKVGAGSAAAASSLQPTAGDNFNYVASYATNKWIGNLEARNINLTTLVTDPNAQWCAEDIAADACEAPAKLVLESGQFSCKTTSSNATSCAALATADDPNPTLTGTDCRVKVQTACTGTMAAKVTSGRVIKFNKAGNTGTVSAPVLEDFEYLKLNPTQQVYFQGASLAAKLSQWGDLTTGPTGQQAAADEGAIVNYLRGNKSLEDSTANPVDDRLFRQREATLGDITESQPAFIAKPKFIYTDPGYAAFSTDQASRIGAIYVGANDGMLHAFYAKNQVAVTPPAKCVVGGGTYCGGEEIWAYIPSPVLPKMAKLADRDYALNHINLVNGDPTIAEVCISGGPVCSTTATKANWRTVLVGGLNGGGRGYYAMDITDPKVPKLLWEFTTANSANLGYTFGNPVVTKLNDGTWVALLTSGYNNGDKDSDGTTDNSPKGDGVGYLYVVDINTGLELKRFPTGVSSTATKATPTGLGQIAAFAQDVLKNNLATYVYGGDLEGNLWRFDINAANGTAPLKLATLVGPSGLAQPITTTPQLGVINKKTVVFVGTGKYLEKSDLDNTDKQTLYAIKDVGASATPIGNPRSTANATNFVAQTLKTDRTIDNEKAVDFGNVLGWRVDMPDAGERFNIDPGLVNGVLLAPTIVPSGGTACAPGGYGWFNYFNYKKGGAIPTIAGGLISEKLNAPAVGFNVLYDAQGKPVITVVESNDPTPKQTKNKNAAGSSTNNRTTLLNKNTDGTYGKKNIWRELIR